SHDGWTFHQPSWIAAEVALIHRPPAEPTQRGKRFAASSRRTANALKGIHIPTKRCLGDESHMERRSSWLRSQPGHKVTHRGQVCRDRFWITRSQSILEFLEESWIIAPRRHLSSPNFPSKRFSDKNVRPTL